MSQTTETHDSMPVLFYDDLQEGHYIEVEYDSPHSDQPQQAAGEVDAVDIVQGVAEVGMGDLERVEIWFTDDDATTNDEWGESNRRLSLVFDDGELYFPRFEGRNAGRWNRLHETGGDITWAMYEDEP